MRYKHISENYSPEEDKHNTISKGDTRKARLTLVHLSKLRNVREYRKYEDKKRAETVSKMYSPAPSEDMGGDLGGLE